jgi:ABC-type multidrug transport system ATPase subunit
MWSAADPSALLRVDGVGKTFSVKAPGWRGSLQRPDRVTVLRDISFEVRRGEIFGLLGENGAGKTTLLHMLAMLVQPDTGSIAIGNVDVIRSPMEARRAIGFCSSADRSFYYRLTLRENLRFFGSLTGRHGSALERRIDEVVAQVELDEFADRTYARCSSGIRQRANIARALIGNPPLLLLDEPTRTVDPVHARAIHTLIRDSLAGRHKKAVVLATNIIDEAWHLCDRIAILKAGRFVTVRRPNPLVRPDYDELFGKIAASDA